MIFFINSLVLQLLKIVKIIHSTQLVLALENKKSRGATLNVCFRMVRNYKRKKGSRRYCDYNEETLKNACLEILEGRMSYEKAAKKFNIPVGTLYNKCNNKHSNYCGHPTIFSEEVENVMVEVINEKTKKNDENNIVEHKILQL